MNSTVKRFKKIVEREEKRVGNFLKKECDKLYDSKKMGIFQEATDTFFTKVYVNDEDKNEFAETQFDKLCDDLKRKHPEEYEYYDNLCFIEKCFVETGFFNAYIILDKLIKKFGFNEIEASKVYAYFLNITLKHILSFHLEHQDTMLKTAEKRADKKIAAKIIKKSVVKRELEKHTEEIKTDQATCRHLRNVINEEGDIIPFEYATDLIWIFEKMDFELDLEIAKTILLKSENDFKFMQEQNELLKQSIENTELIKQTERKKQAEEEINRGLDIKERRSAIQKLKQYLNDDLPIKFITDQELIQIIKLLKIIGYSELQIQNIKKAIIENNTKILALENNAKVNQLKQTCFSPESLEIYEIAESINQNYESLKNASYYKLIETYNLINELLIEMLDNSDDTLYQENLELLSLYINELRDNIFNYSYSDYRNNHYSLLLKKEQ